MYLELNGFFLLQPFHCFRNTFYAKKIYHKAVSLLTHLSGNVRDERKEESADESFGAVKTFLFLAK